MNKSGKSRSTDEGISQSTDLLETMAEELNSQLEKLSYNTSEAEKGHIFLLRFLLLTRFDSPFK